MPVPYHWLFFLENDTTSIVEIKRTDLPGEQNPDKVYHWLFFEKQSHLLHKLEFVSMNAQPDFQERTFQQGQLRFTAEAGTFTDQLTGRQQALQVGRPAELPEDLGRAIAVYLQAL
ncbi:hypothetical protein [Hymenobacter sp. DG25A]|uniref:hypothetical protein n=1 Tax=Hymenobacter sp. DG25A TaxID=1385663 RepID=UPI0006BCA3AE|nr:hypothetical protein [Hymenobacter sp. DG25A]ALD20532.1 hypothetical protein AM218_03970 [Hymenobacter sp. DG25A]